MANTPRIRFKGFTDDWEQRKLGEVIKVCNGRDYKHLDAGKIPVYGTGGYMLSVSEALSYKDDSIGIGRKGTIDRPYILKAPFWTVDTLFYCIPKQNNDLKFIFSVFQNVDWKSMDESTGVPSLSKAAINKVNILTPNVLEQVKIGTYFSILDHLITLHQRKCDETKKLKKFMLQKMFPKNGEKNPEIRFAGFTDDWEQRKLGEIIDAYNEKKPKNIDLPVLTSSRQGIQKQEEHFGSEQKHDTKDYNVIPMGYCTYRNRSDDKTFTFNINHSVKRGIVSKFYPVFSINNGNAKFITEFLNTNLEIKNRLAVLAVGTSQVVLSFANLKELKLCVPSKLEQDKIGNYIDTLDHLITLHQRKCDKLKLIKKFMLQNMFPKKG